MILLTILCPFTVHRTLADFKEPGVSQEIA